MQVCQVDAGPGRACCRSSAVRRTRAPGLVAPLATVGGAWSASTIKAAKLRGVESNGMLCSAKELGIDADASGLLELPDDAPVGAPHRRVPRPARCQHRDQADPEPRRLLQRARHRLRRGRGLWQ
ncbi:MAG: hypothetical protein LKM39_01015 [Chiayiivirga sp.]|nr:hypothetical protein [Chiayiivirga sp.]